MFLSRQEGRDAQDGNQLTQSPYSVWFLALEMRCDTTLLRNPGWAPHHIWWRYSFTSSLNTSSANPEDFVINFIVGFETFRQGPSAAFVQNVDVDHC